MSTQQRRTVTIKDSLNAVAEAAADIFVRFSQETQANGRPFRVALSGGSTPRLLYRLLVTEPYATRVRWDVIHFFFGDERWVSHSHPDSNYKLANDELFDKLSVDPRNVFPMPTEGLSPDEAAEQYEGTLLNEFGTLGGEAGIEGLTIPTFDLIFLGMGPDGHTASLFPHTAVLHEREKLVAAPYVEKLASHRITLTAPVLNNARTVLFLVGGADKAPALKEVLEGEYNPDEYPSQLLRDARGEVIWLLDAPAASLLSF